MGTYIKLDDYNNPNVKRDEFFNEKNRYIQDDSIFKYLPGKIYSYWVNRHLIESFEDSKNVEDIADGKVGLQTGNNDLFLRLWFEVQPSHISFDGNKTVRWYPYNKGGTVRRWYGNNEYVVDWENDGKKVRSYDGAFPRNTEYYFKDGITWSDVKSGPISMRKMPSNCAFDTCAPCLFSDENEELLLAFFNSKIAQEYCDFMTSPLHYTCGAILQIPVLTDGEFDKQKVNECVAIAKEEWDSYETSWDFVKHPLIKYNAKISSVYEEWEQVARDRIIKLKEKEEFFNDYFIRTYNMGESISKEVDDSKITLRTANLTADVKSLISYAVGCIMGRYSLKEEGLVFAGGTWDESKYSSEFMPCEFGVLPITEEQFFQEDLCTRVIDFIEVVYGKDNFSDNLKFIAAALKPDSFDSPKKVIREYLFKSFFEDHYQMYQHRPIYWQCDSGKVGGFRAILYMHRYDENTLPIVRTEYIQELRYKYEEEVQRQKGKLEAATTTAARNSVKRDITLLDKKIVECVAYDELLNHASSSIGKYVFDSDDGVKNNYGKFLSIDGDNTKNILTVIKL
ncbi:BREX-1 system adenine-specific DNA-methyltransferase PglX [Butyrivibrio sp. NC2007]|uniref:BREX-1 system adenine-specific DNA-methyltransferase PglX n=1 Tax=Butyrivibrio sp. NC2007 TaxID=1280683 RepID=UPI0003B51270|nr:BREX-1 system adenine-specific DNA-methyltransferase PglX [Butyrivibrio sp. NC2007]